MNHKDFDADKRELKVELKALLEKADRLKLPMVGIYLSQALDALQAEESGKNEPPTKAR